MDSKFTAQLKEWLETAPALRCHRAGAEMLLRLTGNRIMYANMLARPDKFKQVLEYQLRKHYNFRVAELTVEQVQQMQQQADVALKDSVQRFKTGRRPDHDELPEEIRALFSRNLSILQRMRECQLQARKFALSEQPCKVSDVYPFVKEIVALDKERLDNWFKYDHFKADDEPKAD